MKKQEAIEFIRKEKGFVPYITLFELYDDNDEIPQDFINIITYEYKPSNFMICSAEIAKRLNNLKNEM
jgi:hypothetical protein